MVAGSGWICFSGMLENLEKHEGYAFLEKAYPGIRFFGKRVSRDMLFWNIQGYAFLGYQKASKNTKDTLFWKKRIQGYAFFEKVYPGICFFEKSVSRDMLFWKKRIQGFASGKQAIP